MFENKIIFEKFHEYNGTWRKIVVERSTGDHVDPYLFTPDNVKLRSNNDLIDYLAEHPEFWDVFDGKILNLERKEKPVKMSASTKKLVEFLSAVNSGVSCKEALHSLQHMPKPII